MFQRWRRQLYRHLLCDYRVYFAITSLCIGIYVYKLNMYARLHRYIDLDAVCVVILYNRILLHDMDTMDRIYDCPCVHRLYSVKLHDDNFFCSSEQTARDASWYEDARSRFCHFPFLFHSITEENWRCHSGGPSEKNVKILASLRWTDSNTGG